VIISYLIEVKSDAPAIFSSRLSDGVVVAGAGSVEVVMAGGWLVAGDVVMAGEVTGIEVVGVGDRVGVVAPV
jgi:hypothetical protein